ncbi:hypothetical protein DEA98_25705 [Brucella pseudogrignonensis]|nr:hypothetical protein [Brucella pseudogrignonensis]
MLMIFLLEIFPGPWAKKNRGGRRPAIERQGGRIVAVDEDYRMRRDRVEGNLAEAICWPE